MGFCGKIGQKRGTCKKSKVYKRSTILSESPEDVLNVAYVRKIH